MGFSFLKMNINKLYSIFSNNPVICTDSRKIIKGSIFFSLKGKNFNGNKYALQAVNEGCKFAIIDEEKFAINKKLILVKDSLKTLQRLATLHRQKIDIPIIGITGTNGKTTSKELIKCILSSQLNCYATKGNLNNHIGIPLSILEINDEHEIAVIEMGANHQKEIEFLCKIVKPSHAAITNIGNAHLLGFKNFNGVIKTKNEIYQYIAANKGLLFVNVEDKLLMNLSEKIDRTTYGNVADISGKMTKYENKLCVSYKNNIIKSNLIGDFQFSNIMLSICIGENFNILEENIKSSIQKYIPNNNRSQIIKTKENTLILDAYNANPSSMEAMLISFSKQNYLNKICILGDMLELGEYSLIEHQKIISLCKKLKIKSYFIGEEFHNVNNTIFRTRKDFERKLNSDPIKGKMILLKGSRSIGLENLVEYL